MAYFANGTEGDLYEALVCEGCVHYSGGACPVLDLHNLYNYDAQRDDERGEALKVVLETLIPRAKGGLGNEVCKLNVVLGRAEAGLVDMDPMPLDLLPIDRRQWGGNVVNDDKFGWAANSISFLRLDVADSSAHATWARCDLQGLINNIAGSRVQAHVRELEDNIADTSDAEVLGWKWGVDESTPTLLIKDGEGRDLLFNALLVRLLLAACEAARIANQPSTSSTRLVVASPSLKAPLLFVWEGVVVAGLARIDEEDAGPYRMPSFPAVLCCTCGGHAQREYEFSWEEACRQWASEVSLRDAKTWEAGQ